MVRAIREIVGPILSTLMWVAALAVMLLGATGHIKVIDFAGKLAVIIN